ncbi:MAG: hypothetical protein JW854_06920 [Actinobacteria bacterium]|nr:hypothetical protein [Actinomycetota bacterium]
MREALAIQVHAGHEGTARRTRLVDERPGEKHAHIAYYLCYPSMVKRTCEEERPGPWEQRLR